MERATTPRRTMRYAAALLGLVLTASVALSATPAQAARTTNLFATKQYWTLVQGYFPAAPPVWWSSTNVTFTSTDDTSGTMDGHIRRWQQRKDGLPTRVTVATIPGCNPLPAKGEGTDCPIYSTAPTQAYMIKGTYTYDAASGLLTLRWNPGTLPASYQPMVANEQWRIQLSTDGKLGKAYAVPRGAGPVPSNITDGVGYGSAAPFTSYAPREELHKAQGRFWLGQSLTMESGKRSGWKMANMPSFHFVPHPTLPTVSTYTQILRDGKPNLSCRPDQRTMAGINHLLWTSPTSRDVVWESYRRCLVPRGVAPYVDTKFRVGMHVEMLTQILNDDGELVGLLGGESSAAGVDRNKGWGSHSLHNLVERPMFGRILTTRP